MKRIYTIRPVNRKKMFYDDVEEDNNAIKLDYDKIIIYPKPIEPIPMKWDGVETIGTFRRFTKIYPNGKSTE
jgi:hypothetical protein